MNNLISVGKVLNFHGIKGDIKISYTKGREKFIQKIPSFYVEINGNIKKFTVKKVTLQKQHAIVQTQELQSINDVMLIKGFDVKVEKSIVENELDNNEYLVTDLIGMKVLSLDLESIGKVVFIDRIADKDYLEIEDGNKKHHLIPFVKDIVPKVDIENKEIYINNIEGLIE